MTRRSVSSDKTHTFNRIEKAKEIMDRLWYTYKGAIPYTFVMGNHDYKLDNNDDSDRAFLPEEIFAAETKRWRTELQRFPAQPWKPYWQQIHNGWKFIYLNSFRGNTVSGLPNKKFRHFDDEQIEWHQLMQENFVGQEFQGVITLSAAAQIKRGWPELYR